MPALAPIDGGGSADRASRIEKVARGGATDWLLAAGAAFIALAVAVAALQALSLQPALLPAFFVACALFPLVLFQPAWVVPIFFGVIWTSIGQSYFGGFSPATMGAAVLLPLAAWYARSRPELARDTAIGFLLFGIPIVVTGILSKEGAEIPVDAFKDLAFLFIAALCVRRAADVDRSVLALVFTGMFLSLGAVYSVTVGPTALFPLNDEPDIYGNPPTGAPRAAGPFGEANFFALSLAVLVPFCMYLIAQRGWRVTLGLVAVLLLIAGDFAAQSRGAAIAILFAIVLMGFGSGYKRLRTAAIVVIAGAAVMATVFSAQISGANERSVSGRATENLVAVHMFLDHPVVGVGPGQYPYNYRDYTRRYGNDPRYERAAHSLPLQIAAEQGVIGILGWLGVAILLVRFVRSTGLWRDLLGRALVTSILTYAVGSLFLHGSQLRLLYILLGLLLAYGAALVRERPRAAVT